ncbi:MAG: hypothetical protein R8N24_00345 [Alphaproteobacteria bacterium]|nr:hypothetical protein [Alphaproteobacteria bacterium]
MKKVLAILICTLTLNAHATEMCARDDTVVVPLDATIKGDNYNYNPVEWMWWVDFEYGRLYGAAACLSLQDIRDIENNQELDKAPEILSSNDTKLIGTTGYYNNDSSVPENIRDYCYLQLTHPMVSRWAFVLRWANSAKTCAEACYRFAGEYFKGTLNLRTYIFDSVGK